MVDESDYAFKPRTYPTSDQDASDQDASVPMKNEESLPLESIVERLSEATRDIRRAHDRYDFLQRLVDKKIKMAHERVNQIASRRQDILNPPEGETIMKEEGISRGERY